jgi:hypothetical protein
LAYLAGRSRAVTAGRGDEVEHISEPGLGIMGSLPIPLEILDQFALFRHIE